MRDFLAALWTPSVAYGEIRAIKDRTVYQQFFPLSQPQSYQEAAEFAAQFDGKGFDIYVGVLRRQLPGGKASDVVDMAPVLWADVDPYKDGQHTGVDALGTLLAFPIPPSVIVDSGHGIHAYWLLRDALPTADATLAMKGIAKEIGGDHTHDPARVLRLPGTHNHKNGDKVPVRLLRLDTTRRYNSSDFAEFIDRSGAANGTPHAWQRTPGTPRRNDIPAWLDELIRNGAARGSRSEQCFKAMIWLLRFGWEPEEIYATFAENPNGIGEKMAERGRAGGHRWFDRTMRAAEAAA